MPNFHSVVAQALEVEDGPAPTVEAEVGPVTQPYRTVLLRVQQHVCEWRDSLLHKPLLTESKALSYPKEIEVHTQNKASITAAFQWILASFIVLIYLVHHYDIHHHIFCDSGDYFVLDLGCPAEGGMLR